MQYELRAKGDQFFHVETGRRAGHVVPLNGGKRFRIHRAMTNFGESSKIGVAASMDEALSELADYYFDHWPRWKRERHARRGTDGAYTMRTQFVRCTFYGIFTVEQQGDGKWIVTRYTDELLQDGETATFATAELARHVADLHEIDGVADYPAIDDGYSWDN